MYPFRACITVVLAIEQLFYKLRDLVWNYPDTLVLNKDSLFNTGREVYLLGRPYSHALAGITAIVVTLLFLGITGNRPLLARSKTVLVEGVIMGVNNLGDLQSLAKINPLVPSGIQLEKDLGELIYEPLIRFEQEGNITPILAENVIRRKEGSEYVFELRSGVHWHDSTRRSPHFLSVEDVVATLELLSRLQIEDNAYVQAVKQMAWERSGENSVIICTISAAARELLESDELDRPCTAAQGEKPIISNFLELIAVKIMPANMISDLNTLNINDPAILINRSPVGTGSYRFNGSSGNSIFLTRNELYQSAKPKVTDIEFKMFATEEGAVTALQNSEIHSLATVSTEYTRNIRNYPHVSTHLSPVLRNQYWGIYFNLRENPETEEPLGPSFFSNVNVRKAISMGVDKDRVMESLFNVGQTATGPIYIESDFHSKKAKWSQHDPEAAKRLLEKEGWLLAADGIRTKGEERLSFELTYAQNFDRNKTIETIRQDLLEIGVELIADPRDQKSLVDEAVTAKLFEALFYGMHTFIDPDRYELFHSTETTGLNLAGYNGRVETTQIKDGKTERVSKVDKLLELGRSLDPLGAKEERQQTYFEFQELLAADVPAIFLYHPQFIYYVNNRVTTLDLDLVGSLEQRFRNIELWEIS
jgi:peptide/nickel transport system substrate-binding protein